MKHKVSKMKIQIGDVVMIKGNVKNKGKWNIGVVDKLYQGQDEVIRAVRLRAGKSYYERPIQHLYPLELNCDMVNMVEKPVDDRTEKDAQVTVPQIKSNLNASADTFTPKRTAAAIADIRIKDVINDENNDLL